MSFIDRAIDAFDRSEAALHALMAEALKAKAYSEVAAIEAMAQTLANVRRTHRAVANPATAASETKTDTVVPRAARTVVPVPHARADAPSTPEPSWMRGTVPDRINMQRPLESPAPQTARLSAKRSGARSDSEAANNDSDAEGVGAGRSKWPFVVAVMVFLAVFAWYFAYLSGASLPVWLRQDAPIAAQAAALVPGPRSDGTPTPIDGQPTPQEQDSAAEANPPAAGAPAGPSTSLQLEIHPSTAVWVRVVADGKQVVAGVVGAGERRSVDAQKGLTLRVGDAGAFEYSINGMAGRPLGQSGTVVDARITAENYSGFQVH